ncbi:mitochondrial 54S ribosomal protein uL22m Ecym_6418 [Eremothecium cymbalariae DBVPG|uniref:Ribosomal protein L22 n=1 Tax=Eremothecium cymbalariae (strain CBS 270.75 / DBVPG 7215 / KCTC 17166 / NRRL Y-17582) TaxID=931890 RepID=G8JUL0_ERECY|nr:hypothetical protein Ecym_6418 [Eremothecium cymbalariae DBVPG\
MISRYLIGLSKTRVFNVVGCRGFISSGSLLGSTSKNGSLFGSITKGADVLSNDDPTKTSSRLGLAADAMDKEEMEMDKELKNKVTLQSDSELNEYIVKQQQPIKLAPDLLLSPLKRQIYEANCKLNGGFYKKDTIVRLPNSSAEYKLKLSREEIDALEPSVYVKSYRIKSSMKKATLLLRLLNGLDLKKAITQCHFSDKGISREVGELLQKGLEDGRKLGLDENDLYISQIWTGSDGVWGKRVDIKGRGRAGVIRHRFVHIRCILKTKSVTKKRLEYENSLKELRKKPWVQLADKPVRGSMGGVYRW